MSKSHLLAFRLALLTGAAALCLMTACAGGGCDGQQQPNPSPAGVDSDGDGYTDEAEVAAHPATDPNNANDYPGHVIDTDDDGCSDYEEVNVAGSCDGNPQSPAFRLQGQITVASSLTLDGDTKDSSNTSTVNDNAAAAQSVPNPCSIGGYLGALTTGQDLSDVYRVQMAAGQTATLLLANPQSSDFDLFLYDVNGTPLASSEGVGKAEQVTATTSATFLIQVFDYRDSAKPGTGSGLYTLVIGEDVQATVEGQLHCDCLSSLNNYKSGEVLLKRSSRLSKLERQQRNTDDGLTLLNAANPTLGYERLAIPANRTTTTARTIAASNILQPPYDATIETIKQLRGESDVDWAEPNYIRQACLVPNDEFYKYQWHYTLISLPVAWDTTVGSDQVIVAVIDTGVVLNHPDLQGQTIAGYDFISDPQMSLDGDGLDANPNDPGDSDDPKVPSSWHGTHVSGTIAAHTNNSIGVAGVAWNSRIMPLRVLGKGGGTDHDMIQAMLYAAGLPNDSGLVPPRKADILNLSLSGQGQSQADINTVAAVRAAGCIIVAAAGNESRNGDNYSPGGINGVIDVSAVGPSRQLAPYSNYGNRISLTAPGGDTRLDLNGDGFADGVLSTLGGTTPYQVYEGTSMASPHVAGVVALMKAVDPALTPLDLDQLIAGTHAGTTTRITDDLGAAGKDVYFGNGLINAALAVRAAGEIANTAPIDGPVLRVLPTDLDFGSQSDTLTVTASNLGTGQLTIDSVTPSNAWITANQTGTTGQEFTYTIQVNRTGLADGMYSGNVTFVASGRQVIVTVRMHVGETGATGGNVGTIYVLVVNPKTLATIAQTTATAANNYTFDLPQVPQGEFLLVAGTDIDGNNYVDNEGEASGAYPVRSYPEPIAIQGDTTGVSFAVRYAVNLQTPTTTINAAGVFKR